MRTKHTPKANVAPIHHIIIIEICPIGPRLGPLSLCWLSIRENSMEIRVSRDLYARFDYLHAIRISFSRLIWTRDPRAVLFDNGGWIFGVIVFNIVFELGLIFWRYNDFVLDVDL